MRKSRLLAILLLTLATGAENAVAEGVEGVWLTQKKKVAVRLYPCDEMLCGRIVWLAKPRDRAGALKRDAANPDAALRARPWCGVEAVTGLARDGDGWAGGRFYNPQDGMVYAIDIAPGAGDTLKVRAYVGVRLFGKSEVWTRFEGDPPACETDG